MAAFGYRVESGDASVLISGDTTATPTLAQAATVFSETEPALGFYYHTVASCEMDGPLLTATRKTYPGDVVSRDLMQILVGPDSAEAVYGGDIGMPCP